MLKRPEKPEDLPQVLPLFPLSGGLLLPFSHRPLSVFEPRYVALVDAALRGDRLIGLIQPEDDAMESPPGSPPLRRIGGVGRLTHWEDQGDGRYFIILEGLSRFELMGELTTMTPYRQARISTEAFASDFVRGFGAERVDRPRFEKMMRDYAKFAEFDLNWQEIAATPTGDLVNFCCMVSPYGAAEKQQMLEARTLEDRAETLIALVEYEMAKGAAEGRNPLQ